MSIFLSANKENALMYEMISAVVLTYLEDDVFVLENCIRSILKQTISLNEIIVIDLVQRLDFQELLRRYSSKEKRIVYLVQNGSNFTRIIRGSRMASNPWLAFLETCDVWLSDKIECQMNSLHNKNYKQNALSITNYYIGRVNESIPEIIYTSVDHDIKRWANVVDGLLFQSDFSIISGIVVHRSFFLDIFSNCGDLEGWRFLARLFEMADVLFLERICYIRKFLEISKSRKLHEKYDALIQLKELMIYRYGIAYWNKMISYCCREAVSLNMPKEAKDLYLLLDFGDVDNDRVFPLDDIEGYVCQKELERLQKFCEEHTYVACYGAGRYGKKILIYLQTIGHDVKNILVSKNHKRESQLLDISILEYNKSLLNKYDGIIIAMNLIIYPDVMLKMRKEFNGDVFAINDNIISCI